MYKQINILIECATLVTTPTDIDTVLSYNTKTDHPWNFKYLPRVP
jgi:hypothetical protein